jgi:hypothetical protein
MQENGPRSWLKEPSINWALASSHPTLGKPSGFLGAALVEVIQCWSSLGAASAPLGDPSEPHASDWPRCLISVVLVVFETLTAILIL